LPEQTIVTLPFAVTLGNTSRLRQCIVSEKVVCNNPAKNDIYQKLSVYTLLIAICITDGNTKLRCWSEMEVCEYSAYTSMVLGISYYRTKLS
jgi:hypothetical protein